MKFRETKVFGVFIIVLATLFWAIGGNVGAFLFKSKEVTPEHLVTIRLVIAGSIQLVAHYFDKSKNFFNVFENRKDIFRMLLFAFGGLFTMQYFYFVTVKHSNAATAIVLQQFAPFFVILISSIVARRFPPLKTVLALILALYGGFLLITHGDIGSLAVSKIALLSGLMGTLGSTLFNILPHPLQKKYGVIAVNGWSMLIAGLVFGLLNQPWKIPFIIDLQSILGILYVSIFGTLIPFLIYMTGAQIVSPVIASILSLLETVFSTIIATTFMGVIFIYLDYIGIALVVTALILIMIPRRSRRPEDQL
ncbi:MAG: EamA family transporter [Tissierellia bacterium]|jgi:drug/metabolite transporter (DMT)-like permease|nr:EamA family transporter [Tissierellia bacterium]